MTHARRSRLFGAALWAFVVYVQVHLTVEARAHRVEEVPVER